MAEKYDVDKNLCLALAETESSGKGERIRFGQISKTYYGPFGIHKCFLKKWNIVDWKVNTEVGIRALSGHLYRANGNLHNALKKYNTGDKGEKYNKYVRRIKNLKKQYEKENVFKKGDNEPIKISKNSSN